MSNVLIAIIILLITFVLMGLAVYDNIEASKRSSLAMTVGSKLSRVANNNQEMSLELDRFVYSSGEESASGLAYYDSEMMQREAFGSVSFRYHQNGVGYFTCAQSTDTSEPVREAFAIVARDRPPSFVSGACGEVDSPVTNLVVVSMRMN